MFISDTGIYYFIMWFLAYGMCGWLLESVYMSICNKKITNRGFMKSPMCPIYSVGALIVYYFLKPISQNLILVFLVGSVVATIVEFITAHLMIRIFGDFWWDYDDKPFNYKGILCLESSIAWGIYSVCLFVFLHKGITFLIDLIPRTKGVIAAIVLLTVFSVDFTVTMYQKKKDDIPSSLLEIRDRIKERINKVL